MHIEQRIKLVFLRYGIILGVIYLAFTILSFYFITALTKSPIWFIGVPILFRLFIPMLLTLYFCFKGRVKVGGLWTFKQAVTGVFVMLIIAFVIQFLGKNIIFDRFVEPDNIHKTQVAAINAKTLNLQQLGRDQKTIDKEVGEMKKDLAQQTNATTISGVLQELIFSIIFIFLFALLFGALFRNAEYVPADKLKK